MKSIIDAAYLVIERAGSPAAIACLREVLREYARQKAKYADIQRIRIKTTIQKKAKYQDHRVFDAEFAAGDTAIVINNNFENIRCVSDDPAQVVFSLPLSEEGKTWEYCLKLGAKNGKN